MKWPVDVPIDVIDAVTRARRAQSDEATSYLFEQRVYVYPATNQYSVLYDRVLSLASALGAALVLSRGDVRRLLRDHISVVIVVPNGMASAEVEAHIGLDAATDTGVLFVIDERSLAHVVRDTVGLVR